MIGFKKTTLRDTEKNGIILAEFRSALEKKHFDDKEIEQYIGYITYYLDHYRERFGEDQEIEYLILKKYRKAELRVNVKAEKYAPDDFSDPNRISAELGLNSMLNNNAESMTNKYVRGVNILSFSTPTRKGKTILSNPMLWAVILGFACGFLCLLLPDSARDTILNDIATPVRSTCISILTGIVSPMIFVSILSAVASMENINQLTNLGFKIFKRFVFVILAVMAISIVFMLLVFYHSFGSDITEFDFGSVIDTLLDILPTDIISPFQNCNTPQLVVMGALFGAALLILGEKVSGVTNAIIQINSWVVKAMDIVLIVMPVIPFISIFIAIGQGDFKSLLNGWEFIVAVYAITAICSIFKLLKVSIKFKVKLSVLWKALLPMVINAFCSGNFDTALQLEYELSRDKLGIKEEFSSFWIPMGYAMMSPAATIYMIVPSFMILKYNNTPISLSFLVVLIIIAFELSLASPGVTASWTILFTALSLSTDYVGLCVMYNLFTNNFTTGYVALQSGLEQIEAADKFDSIDWSYLKGTKCQSKA